MRDKDGVVVIEEVAAVVVVVVVVMVLLLVEVPLLVVVCRKQTQRRVRWWGIPERGRQIGDGVAISTNANVNIAIKAETRSSRKFHGR